jgi:hypothetical protein
LKVEGFGIAYRLYVWFRWPAPRDFLKDSKRFSFFLVGNASWLTPVFFAALGAFLESYFRFPNHLRTRVNAKKDDTGPRGMSLRSVLTSPHERAIIRHFKTQKCVDMPKSDLDAIDCRIVAELQSDGRLSNVAWSGCLRTWSHNVPMARCRNAR